MVKIIRNILYMDDKAIILFSNVIKFPSELAAEIVGEEYKKRCIWFPELDKKSYMEIVRLCDVHIEPYPFGGLNTSYDAFDYNIPVITMPSNKISGQFTYGLYKKMDDAYNVDIVKDCVATSHSDYINKAIDIVKNRKRMGMIRRKIEYAKTAIFMEIDSVNEYEELFSNLLK